MKPNYNEKEFVEKTVRLGRTAKVVKGGRRFSFNALVVVGDRNGNIGYGFGKAKEVPMAIVKATRHAKRNLCEVKIKRTGEKGENVTIPYPITLKYKSTILLLKPATPGTGIIACGPVRAVLEAAGINNILTKSIGSNNSINLVKATILALQRMNTKEDVAYRRCIEIGKLFE
ncbi:MAG: 30S ribosomal protein S5 [Exilispira sp.]|nr:30S ribosomal protein S5 [Exilispira sp.]